MALTFVGFVQGEAVTTLDWSLLADGLGGDYDYHGDGFRPSAGLGAREVAISAGRTSTATNGASTMGRRCDGSLP